MNNCKGTRVVPSITVSDNYNRLVNKPQINGIELSGDMTSKELNLLTNDIQEYETLTLGEAKKDSYVLLFPEDGQPNRITLGEVTSGKFSTATSVDEVDVGNYLFKKLEEK